MMLSEIILQAVITGLVAGPIIAVSNAIFTKRIVKAAERFDKNLVREFRTFLKKVNGTKARQG